MMKIYFNNYSTEHLGPIYKDNYIDTDGLIVEVDIDLTEVNYMYVNFKVGQLSYTNDVSIVDIENNIVSVPIPTEVLKEGTHQLELVAAMNNGSVIPSRTYKYLVDKSLENPNAVEAESCYPILITLIEEVTGKIDEVNEVIEEVELSEQARKEEHTELVNELSSYSSDINNVKDRVEVLEAKVTDNEVIVDLKNKVNNHEGRISANEKTIRHQSVLIDALFDLTETISITEEGNAISLPQSKEGTIIIDELQGNTLVNYCTNGSEELTLNNEINVQGANVTLTDTVDNGKVDVVCEGNTLVNLVPKCEDLIWDGDTGFNFNVWKHSGTLLYPTKHSTTYTVVVNIKQNNLALNGELKNTNYGHLRSVGGFNNADITIPNNYVGIYKKAITSTDTGGHRNLNELAWSVSGKNPEGDILINQGKLIIGDIMLLEGDWTNKEISYFEGMKSSFELEDNKVEINACNSNIRFGKGGKINVNS